MNPLGRIKQFARTVIEHGVTYRKELDLVNSLNQVNQIRLALEYKDRLVQGLPLPRLNDVEFRCFSQHGEDGILHFIFSVIGTTNKHCLELCAGDGVESNTANLILNHGWIGLLFDGNVKNVQRGNRFYTQSRDTAIWPPTFIHAWVTAENVNELITSGGMSGEIDLLSLDMDGVDWWIWQAIQVVSPRVVVVEYQDIWGPEIAVTVPYKPDFRAELGKEGYPDYCGASLSAFCKLACQKGYRLVGTTRYGINAFFVRNDLGATVLPEIAVADCFGHPLAKWGMETRLSRVQNKEWVQV